MDLCSTKKAGKNSARASILFPFERRLEITYPGPTRSENHSLIMNG
jgi:hypothetical protein